MLIKGIDAVNTAVKQINSFQKKEIKPITTGVPHWDYHLLGGFYPSTIAGIIGLSGHGKSYELERILAHVEDNYGDEVISVRCIWELSVFKVLVREMAKITGKSAREVMTEIPQKDVELLYKKVCDRYRRKGIFIQPTPVTADEFYFDIKEKIKQYPDRKILVSCDNLENTMVTNSDQKGSMDALLQKVNILIKEHPYICFIILNQMNRDYYLRLDNPKKHPIIEGDIYGSSYLTKLCDVLMAKIIPYRLGLDKWNTFSNHRYQYIDDKFKDIGANTSRFNAIGNAFFQFIKSRDISLEYDIQDLFVEQIYTPPVELQQQNTSEREESIDFTF